MTNHLKLICNVCRYPWHYQHSDAKTLLIIAVIIIFIVIEETFSGASLSYHKGNSIHTTGWRWVRGEKYYSVRFEVSTAVQLRSSLFSSHLKGS